MKTASAKLVVGLVGGIGSGKSLLAEEFKRHGACVISGDQLGHEALRQPDIIDQVTNRWGRGVLTERGDVDRRQVGAIVFADASQRQALEQMVFPFIRHRIETEIAAAQAKPVCKLVVLDAAIMMEAGWDHVCDQMVFVDVPRPVRLERLARQRGWTNQEVAAREKAQMPLDVKARRADVRIDNAGSAADLVRQVEDLLRRWNID